jgi:FkbM family methyltransferase
MTAILNLGQRVVNRAREELFTRYAIPHTRRERIAKRFIAKFLPAAPVIVECGAHLGDDTVEMSSIWPDGVIHAFEPVPELYARLTRRVSEFRNVRCYPIAISDRSGSQKMFISAGGSDASSSLLRPADHLASHPDVTFDEEREVATTTFQAWAASEGVDAVDLFWLDMQGAEFPSMVASRDLVRRARAVHTEVSTRATYEGVAQYAEVKNWMESQGFAIAAEAVPKGWDMGNVLFVRRDLGR